jgi:hypothetical protein
MSILTVKTTKRENTEYDHALLVKFAMSYVKIAFFQQPLCGFDRSSLGKFHLPPRIRKRRHSVAILPEIGIKPENTSITGGLNGYI